MSNQTYDAYYIDIPMENVFNSFVNNTFTDNSTISQETNNQSNINSSTDPTPITPSLTNLWGSERTFQRIQTKFQLTILKEYPDTPCAYCGRLLYKKKVTWITYNPSETYP